MTSLSTAELNSLKIKVQLVKADAYVKALELYKEDYRRHISGEAKPDPDRVHGELHAAIIDQVMSLSETKRLELLTTFIHGSVSDLVTKQMEAFLFSNTVTVDNCEATFDKCIAHVKSVQAEMEAELLAGTVAE